jgi:hypothetical protein
MVGVAVATTVDSIEARNRLSMIPIVTKMIRLRDMISFLKVRTLTQSTLKTQIFLFDQRKSAFTPALAPGASVCVPKTLGKVIGV